MKRRTDYSLYILKLIAFFLGGLLVGLLHWIVRAVSGSQD